MNKESTDKMNELYKQHNWACDGGLWELATEISDKMAELIKEEIRKDKELKPIATKFWGLLG